MERAGLSGRGWRQACLLLWLASPCLAAQPAPPKPPPAAPATPVPAASPAAPAPTEEYRVGAGDTLDISVFGNEDLSRVATVQPSGVVTLPLLGDVPVAELTVPEIKRKLTALLARDYLVNPQVEVKVRDYQSRFVSVLGEVNAPGRKPLRGRTRLIDVLLEAGGFTPRASGEVVISRADGSFESGERVLRVRLSGANPTPQDQINLEQPLRHGDIVTAAPKFYVTVEGEVQRPGRYVLENDLTVSGAISTAGGLTRFGAGDVKLRRIDPQSGKVTIVDVSLKAVRQGKRPDLELQANDVITVPKRLF
jgi:polysaccharide export outer membrane protein